MHEAFAGLLGLLVRVPDVVWSGLIASALTFVGVMWSNRSNTNRLLLQLKHDSSEKSKERLSQLHRDVYLKAVDETTKVNNILGRIPYSDPAGTEASDGISGFLGAIAKLQLVCEPATYKLASELSTRVVEAYFTLLQRSLPIHDENITARIADDFCNRNQTEVARVIEAMRAMNESGEHNEVRFQALQTSYETAKSLMDQFAEDRRLARLRIEDGYRTYMLELLAQARSTSKLQMELIASLRGELGLETDMHALQLTVEEGSKRIEESLKKLVAELQRDDE